MKYEDIKTELEEITEATSDPINEDVVSDVTERLEMLSSYLPRTAMLKAQADSLYAYVIGEAMKQEYEKNPKITISIVKDIIRGKLWKYIYITTLADRLNSAITHQIDAMRSFLSFLKADMQNVQNEN